MNLIKNWHNWQIARLERKLEIQQKRCDALATIEREYKNSYYTDRLYDEVCKRIELHSKLKFLKARYGSDTQPPHTDADRYTPDTHTEFDPQR